MSAEPIVATQVARVRDAMTRWVVTVDDGTSIGSAIDVTTACGHRHLVVVDEQQRLLDIIPVSLLSTALLTHLATPHQPVGQVVVAHPLRVAPDAPLADAVTAMLDAAADAIGVVGADGRLAGILTWPDVGRYVTDTARPAPVPHPRRP